MCTLFINYNNHPRNKNIIIKNEEECWTCEINLIKNVINLILQS